LHLPLMTRLRTSVFTAAAVLSWTIPAGADVDSGSYLAARQAGIEGNYSAAASYFHNALIADPNNQALLEQTTTAFLGTGQVATAAELGLDLIDTGAESQIANIATMAHYAKTENWDGIFAQLEAGHEVGPLLDGLVQSWAFFADGQTDRALESFDTVIATPGLTTFGYMHKAIALTMLGDFEAADAIYSLSQENGFQPTRSTVMAHLQVLCRLGEFGRASDLLARVFGSDTAPDVETLREAINAQNVPFLNDFVTDPSEGIAKAFQDLTNVLKDEANASYLLLYAQAARYIAPQNANTHLSAARLLNDLKQHSAAAEIFAQVHPDDDAFQSAEMGRADALRRAGRLDHAIDVLIQLTQENSDSPMIHASLGDIYRQQKNYSDANIAYDASLRGFGEESSVRWWLLYSRGITFERLDMWEEAEADFREALLLNPDNPSVLNYLGYSLVDRGMKFDEALEMIEPAVEARPGNGAIIDSLGWVYFKLGRYEEAVAPLERAAELVPSDPIVSDHLADAYWKVGRFTEARFQWRRALSFEPDEAEAELIRRKLAIGLDAVYAQEGTGSPSVEVANDTH